MVVATHRALVARLAPRLARARLAPATGARLPATREPISEGFVASRGGASCRTAGAARTLAWTTAPSSASSTRGPALFRARASHRARHPRPRGVLATPLRASADGPAAAPAHPPSAREISSSAVVCYGKPAPGVNVTHQLITFFRFTELKDPNAEVEAHHAYIAENKLEVRGRIYVNEQGINAQMSGKGTDGETYARWVESRPGFTGMRISVYPTDAHGHPKLSLRYKPQLVQLEGGTAHLPLHDPNARAKPLKPTEWHEMLGKVIERQVDAPVLLDVRNGYEWDVGHFKGAQRPVQESFRETVETNVDDVVGPLSGVDKDKPIMMYCTGGIRCDVYSTVLKQQGYSNVFTLEGGVQAYFEEFGEREDQRWDDHLFVFDSRLAMTPGGLPASEAGAEAATLECYCCKERKAPPPHRNCPNVDCNRLFLVCPACTSKYGGFCCPECGKASHVRPALLQPGRYQRYVHYTEGEAMSRASRRGPGRQQRRERRRMRKRLEAAKRTAEAVARGETPRDLIRAVRVLEKAAENPGEFGGPASGGGVVGEGTGTLAARTRTIIKAAGLDEESVGGYDSGAGSFIEEGGGDDRYVIARARLREAAEAIAAGRVPGVDLRDLIGETAAPAEEAGDEAEANQP